MRSGLNYGVKPPSVHIMIGDPIYRGRGVGRSVMQSAIEYIRDVLEFTTINTRHLAKNIPVEALNQSLGFRKDGDIYVDKNNLV